MTANTSATGGYLAPTPVQFVEDAALDALLQGLVVGITPLPGNLVRPRWQPEPPDIPVFGTNWCAIGVTGEPQDAWSYQTLNADGSYSETSWDTVEVLTSFYGPAARSNAKLFRMGLLVKQNLETLQLQGMGLLDAGSVTVVPSLENERWLYRVDLPFRCRRATVVDYGVLTVESFVGELLADEGVHGEVIIYNIEVTQP